MNRFQLFWKNPLSSQQDAVSLAILIAFTLTIALLWKIVVEKHILD